MSALAHGLGHDAVAPDWPKLALPELVPLLARYPRLGAVQAVAWHSPRPFAASAIVRCAHGPVFVKRHDARVRSVAALLEEHAFIAHLRRHGAAVPEVLATVTGATAVAGVHGTCEVHAVGEGADTYRDAHSWTPVRSVEDAAALGFALGRLHEAAAGYIAPARQALLLVAGDALIRAPDLGTAVERLAAGAPLLRAALAGRPWRSDLAGALSGWHAALQPHLAALQPLWAHGDAHASNLLWGHGAVSAVLDFGLCNRASAAFDLATAIERNAIAWLDSAPSHTDIGHTGLAHAILRGYDAARPLAAAERRALRHLLPLVHVDFALSELMYFHGVTGSARHAEAAYSEFLLGHARWFSCADGKRFLEELA